MPASVAIGDPSAWVLVHAVQEILTRPEEPDGSDGRTERLEVLRHETFPEVLAEREQEHRHGDGHDIALQPERIGDASSRGRHGGLAPVAGVAEGRRSINASFSRLITRALDRLVAPGNGRPARARRSGGGAGGTAGSRAPARP